jgi:hypothetical protein
MLKINFKSFLCAFLFCISSIFSGYTQEIVFKKNISFKDNYSYDRIIPAKDAGFVAVFGSKQLGNSFDYYDTNFNLIKTLIPKDWKKAKDEYFYPEYFVANENTILYVQNEEDKRLFYINSINQAGISSSYALEYKEEGTDIVGLFCLNNKFILITRHKEPKGFVKYFLYKIDENNLTGTSYKVMEINQDKYESSFFNSEKEDLKMRTLWKVGGEADNKLVFIKAYIKSESAKDSVKVESCEVDVEGKVSNKYKYAPFTKTVSDAYKQASLESIFDSEAKAFYIIGYLGSTKEIGSNGFFVSKYNYKSTLQYSNFYLNKKIENDLGIKLITEAATAVPLRKRYIFDPFNHSIYMETLYGNDNGDIYNVIGLDQAGTIFEIGRGKIENEAIDDFQNTLTTNLSATFHTKITVVYKDEKSEYNAKRIKNNVDYIDILTYKEGVEIKNEQTKFRDFWSANSDYYYLFDTGIKTGIRIVKIKRK